MKPNIRNYCHGERAPSTPWGPAQYVKAFGRGVAEVGCAQHGGMRVSRALGLKRFHPKVLGCAIERTRYFWFEEDCAYMLVVMSMPELFEKRLLEDAKVSVMNWYPDEYTLMTGESVPVEKSYTLRKRRFESETKNRFVARCARGDWAQDVPKGMVSLSCERVVDKMIAEFLVPSEMYKDRKEHFGFVIDESDSRIVRVGEFARGVKDHGRMGIRTN